MTVQPVLIADTWRASASSGTFQAENPSTGEPLREVYPLSSWADIDAALEAATAAADELRQASPDRLADFLERYADAIEKHSEALVAMAHAETALPASPRLADVELPRTSGQLRQAARAAREGSWALPTIDTQAGIRSCHEPLGPVFVFGPNNFPFAFNSIAGGDFAAAIATGCPVIAKGNTSHPGTTRLLGEAAHAAAQQAGLPAGTVQLLYRTSHDDGARAVADPRTGATGYTGSRSAGLVLKAAADAAGKPIYLELSSINPVVMLPGAIRSRGEEVATEFTTSCLMGTGQFCTNPGVVILLAGAETEKFIDAVAEKFKAAPCGTLLSSGVARALEKNVARLVDSGAKLLTGGSPVDEPGFHYANTLLRVAAEEFLRDPEAFQIEAFGNSSLLVVADDVKQVSAVVDRLEGNLTGCVYSDSAGSDDGMYAEVAPRLRAKVGRLLNDKMPTGVAVSPAMNHGGPYPATGHPGFTAVGIPASLRRFSALVCYDNVRPTRLPAILQDKNARGTWRWIDGVWSQSDVAGQSG
ncbi:MAG: aldehyde dehydrogenase (NADP(+)) [Planctomycetota bacterium]|nr:MAG: aldehyde dehydrogenase (NADP(+)) [Planctomycetota bacterium]